MSVWRPARCLFTKATSTTLPKATPQRSFQTSAIRQGRKRRPHYPSIKADDLKLLNEAAEAEYPRYDTSETELLAKKYTPSQIAAIKAAEAAIDPRDVMIQGEERSDPWRLPYEDDLAEVDPVTDKKPWISQENFPAGSTHVRFANDVERDAAIAQLATQNLAKMYPDGIPEGTLDEAQEQALQDAIEASMSQAAMDPRAVYTSNNKAVLETLADPAYSVIQPDLPRLENRMARQTRRLSTEEEEDPRQKRLLQYLGWDKQKLRSIRVKTLVVHSVTNQTRMGKIRSLYYLTIAGNQDGLLGVGEGKSVEPDEGRKQSVMSAIRNMRPVPRYENRTTFGDLEMKVGATKVQLFARPPGKSHPTTYSCNIQLTNPNRLWSPHPAPHLRTRTRRRPTRPRRTHTALAQQDERDQGDVGGADEPETAGRDCAGERQEDGGCAEGVLWWECTLVESRLHSIGGFRCRRLACVSYQSHFWKRPSLGYMRRSKVGIISYRLSHPRSIPSPLFRFLTHHPNSFILPIHTLPPPLPTPIPLLIPLPNLLIQHNTIHTRLQQRKHKTRLPLQAPQTIQYSRARRIRQIEKKRGHL